MKTFHAANRILFFVGLAVFLCSAPIDIISQWASNQHYDFWQVAIVFIYSLIICFVISTVAVIGGGTIKH